MPGGFNGFGPGTASITFGTPFTFRKPPATVSSSTTSAATSAASLSSPLPQSQKSPTASQIHPLSTTSSATAQQDSASISPTQSQGQGPASTSPLVTLNGSPSVTLGGNPMSESSAQVPVSLQPPENPSAGIHRHALSRGAVVGVALVIVTVVLTLTIIFCRHHRRRNQSRMVSPFVHLMSGSSATQSTASEIQTDASAARLQYLEKELRGARAEMVENGASTQIVERRVPDDAGGSAEEPTAEGSIPERASSNDQQSGADGGTAALLARIRELESQIRSTRASGVSDDPPPRVQWSEEIFLTKWIFNAPLTQWDSYWRQATKAVETQELEAGTDCDRPSNQKVTASKEFPGPKEGRTGESREKMAPGKMGARPYLCVESSGDQQNNFIPVGRKAVKPLGFWSRHTNGAAMNDWYKRGQKVGHETGRKHIKVGLEGVEQRGWAEEEGMSKNIWGNSTAEEPFA
ncbi:hypothetical protein B0H13DRAFT_1923915 [Mycena leptocephala]|nr:hypothetical protein B0H13DRAFT_1923915 [Mycena leptocephala]